MLTRRNALKVSAAAIAYPSLTGLSQNPAAKLKIIQIGTGHPHAGGKMNVYRNSSDFEVIAVVESNAQLRAAAEKSSVYQDLPFITLEQALNTPELGALAIETEVRDLLDHAEKAIDAGFPIHLDKPAGSNFAHYQRIVKKAEQKKLTIQMGYMYRYNPAVQLMRDFLEQGWLGDPFEVQATMSKVLGAQSRKNIAQYPGGIMFELACHVIDLVIGVLGAPDQVHAFPRQSLKDAPDNLVDNMLAVFEYPRATATVRSSALEVDGFARRHIAVAGTGGTCHIQPLDRPTMKVTFDQSHGKYKKGYQTIEFDPPYKRYVGDAADFAKIIRGEKESDFSPQHDLAVQKAVLQASALPLA